MNPGLRQKGGGSCSSGFTLIELLAVIAILAVLAALIFGVTSRVLTNASEAKITSNLRQCHQAIQLFITDNGGKFPPVDGRIVSSAARWRWYGNMSPAGEPYENPFLDYFGAADVREVNRVTILPSKFSEEMTVQGGEGTFGFPPYVANYRLMVNTIGVPLVAQALVEKPAGTILLAEPHPDGPGAGFHEAGGWNRVGDPEKNGRLKILWADGHVTDEEKSKLLEDPAKVMLPTKQY